MIGVYVVVGVVGLVVLYAMGTYNGLVRLRQQVRESWSGIDTELKRRYNLIPNLVETVKGYASHEQETLDRVVSARARAVESTGTPETQAQDENVLVGALRQLFAVVENYPDLKANQNFLQLQGQLTATEDRIQASRRFYNANVRELNTRTEVFPSNVIASMFGFQKEQFFEIEEAAREVPKVDFSGSQA
jgi:LemA protein